MQIGLAEVRGEVQHLGINFEVSSFRANESLAEFTVVSTFNGGADVSAAVKFTPRDLGNLACVGQWQGDVKAQGSLTPGEFTVVSTLEHAAKDENGLSLSFASQEVPVNLKMSPPSFQALLDHNPKLYVQCAGGVVGKLFGAGSRDTFEYTVARRHMPIRIPKSQFMAFGTTLYLHPEWNEGKTIRLVFDSPRWNL
jgi:hypothetical protein